MVATRLGSVFRAILIGALSEDNTDIWNAFYSHISFPDKVVLDPFMGAGTALGEALKLGCTVVGSDINPVSAFQVSKALEPVDIYELQLAFERIKNKVQPQIQPMYQAVDPETGNIADILYCFWIMTAICPACKTHVWLFDTSIFAKNAYPRKVPAAWSVCFACGEINATRYNALNLRCSGCQREYNPQDGVAEGAKATCQNCGFVFRIVDAIAHTGRMPEYEMYALLILTAEGKKKYIRANEADKELYNRAHTLLKNKTFCFPPVSSNQDITQISFFAIITVNGGNSSMIDNYIVFHFFCKLSWRNRIETVVNCSYYFFQVFWSTIIYSVPIKGKEQGLLDRFSITIY